MTAIVERVRPCQHSLALPPRPSSERPAGRAVWLGFFVVIVSAVMDLLDSTIAQTGAPTIRRDLGGSLRGPRMDNRRAVA